MTKLKICFVDTVGLKYNGHTLNERGLGGSESAIIFMSRELVKLGFDVTVFNKCDGEGVYDGVNYLSIDKCATNEEYFDIMIASRSCLPYVPLEFRQTVLDQWGFDVAWIHNVVSKSRYKVLWLHDTFCSGDNWLEHILVDGYFDEVFTLSDWHTHYICHAAHGHGARRYEAMKRKVFQTRNGITSYIDEVDIAAKDKNLFVYNASITKGMVPLLDECWPRIKKEIPDAKLVVIGGYYRGANADGPDEQENLYWQKREQYDGKDGITFTGIIKQDEIAKILAKASLFVYPGIFPETFGISTLEAINYNVPLVGCRFGALEEIAAESTSFLIDYPIDYDANQIDRFVAMVKRAYSDEYLRQQKAYACNDFKQWIGWDKVALQWRQHFYKVLGLYLPPQATQEVRRINSALARLFKRRHLNEEDVYEDYSMQHKNKIVVVTPVYNAEKYIDKCIKSVAAQLYSNYVHVIVDDASTDDTFKVIHETIDSLDPELQSRFTVYQWHPDDKKCALQNQVFAINQASLSSQDIIVLLDGDDWFVNDPDIFNYINREYNEGAAMTYGSCHSLADSIDLIAQPYPLEVRQSKTYRKHLFNWGMPYTHLRTFRAAKFDAIDENALMDADGNYYRAGGDNALFYALLEQCEPDEVRTIQKVLYVYNDLNPLNDYKVNGEEQNKTAAEVRNMQSNDRLTSILIALPTAKYIETETFLSIYRLDKPENTHVHLECFYGYNIDQIRNLIAHFAIENEFDYVLCVDSDIILPKDALTKMLSHDKAIVSGVYIQRKPHEHIPEIYTENEHGGHVNIDPSKLQKPGLMKIAACGFGCVLVRTDVFAEVGYPQFKYYSSIDFAETLSEDIDFCIKARDHGFTIFADTSIKCDHIGMTKFR